MKKYKYLIIIALNFSHSMRKNPCSRAAAQTKQPGHFVMYATRYLLNTIKKSLLSTIRISEVYDFWYPHPIFDIACDSKSYCGRVKTEDTFAHKTLILCQFRSINYQFEI